ncbi:MAG: DUF6600 domain-containing protein [Pyrinomonadaceae bacterium]
MHSTRKVFWAFSLMVTLLLGTGVSAFEVDDDIPEVKARVARISFIRGNVQIRRAGSQDWEIAVLNLPVVEGDEVTTDAGGRFEIQFNSYTHLRIGENSYLKIANLKDEGIAVSLPEGMLTLRITNFDKDGTYFEIDAPKTTVAVQKAGMYRVDALKDSSGQVRVAVTDDGEARVYSDSSGFTLKNGRSAKISTEGNLAGEWDTADASRFADEFDAWSLERDFAIAKLLKDAKYDTYYDRDIYGAEDLSEHGEWIHTRKYGYVWKPFSNSTNQYSDWSPYRYGQWRWIPPYGWTWVNDEPWGWATYHHGRWIYDNGWYWTPYGHFRNRRSWWSPALVVVSILNNNICWYPLPYEYGYYNYNYHWTTNNYYGRNWNGNGHGNGNRHGNGNGNPNPSPNPNASPAPAPSPTHRLGPGSLTTREQRLAWQRTPPFLRVPPGSVVSVPAGEFGNDRKGFQTVSPTTAKTVLSGVNDPGESPPLLPTYSEVDRRMGREIRTERPPTAKTVAQIKTGAADRKSNGPIDQELQKTRIFGNRSPVPINPGTDEPVKAERSRRTGAVERRLIVRSPESQERKTEVLETRESKTASPIPTYVPPPEQNTERERRPVRRPQADPPPQHKERQREPVREPMNDPPPRSDPSPRYDPPPKNDPPQRSEPAPRSDPPQKNDPPPTKSEPPAENRKSKDGS